MHIITYGIHALGPCVAGPQYRGFHAAVSHAMPHGLQQTGQSGTASYYRTQEEVRGEVGGGGGSGGRGGALQEGGGGCWNR